MSPAIEVNRIGTVARHALATRGDWTVAAVFPRAVYLNRASDWLCLVPAGAGPGPLYVNCTNPPPDWTAQFTVGETFPTLDVSRATTWTPPPPPAAGPAGLATLDAWLASNPPPTDGLGTFAKPSPTASTPVTERAAPIIAALAESQVPDNVTALIGLGPGLTPSGDDLLGALIVTLQAIGRHTFANDLAESITPAFDQTTPISAAYLRAAIAGQASARVHAALNACISGNDLPATCAALTAIGHTSGWDALAGIAIGLRSATSAA